MTAEQMRALAERVVALDGPCRETDAEIMFDLFAQPVGVHPKDGGPRAYLWPEDNPSWNFGIRFPSRDRDWFAKQAKPDGVEKLLIFRDGALVLMNDIRIPRLTASLDAAMSLVPEGWLMQLSDWQAPILRQQGPWQALLTRDRDDFREGFDARCDHATTPALALTAAALLARAETMGGDDE